MKHRQPKYKLIQLHWKTEIKLKVCTPIIPQSTPRYKSQNSDSQTLMCLRFTWRFCFSLLDTRVFHAAGEGVAHQFAFVISSQIIWRRQWHPTPVLLPGKSHGQRSLLGIYINTYVCTREGNGTPFQYSFLENPMDGGAWWAPVHGVAKSWARLSDFTFTFHFPALEKEMAPHSSVLAWRIPGTGSLVGSHRVRHY